MFRSKWGGAEIEKAIRRMLVKPFNLLRTVELIEIISLSHVTAKVDHVRNGKLSTGIQT